MAKWEINNDSKVEKHPYVTKVSVTKDMSEGQKEWARLYNSMRDFLEKIGRMEEK